MSKVSTRVYRTNSTTLISACIYPMKKCGNTRVGKNTVIAYIDYSKVQSECSKCFLDGAHLSTDELKDIVLNRIFTCRLLPMTWINAERICLNSYLAWIRRVACGDEAVIDG